MKKTTIKNIRKPNIYFSNRYFYSARYSTRKGVDKGALEIHNPLIGNYLFSGKTKIGPYGPAILFKHFFGKRTTRTKEALLEFMKEQTAERLTYASLLNSLQIITQWNHIQLESLSDICVEILLIVRTGDHKKPLEVDSVKFHVKLPEEENKVNVKHLKMSANPLYVRNLDYIFSTSWSYLSIEPSKLYQFDILICFSEGIVRT